MIATLLKKLADLHETLEQLANMRAAQAAALDDLVWNPAADPYFGREADCAHARSRWKRLLSAECDRLAREASTFDRLAGRLRSAVS